MKYFKSGSTILSEVDIEVLVYEDILKDKISYIEEHLRVNYWVNANQAREVIFVDKDLAEKAAKFIGEDGSSLDLDEAEEIVKELMPRMRGQDRFQK